MFRRFFTACGASLLLAAVACSSDTSSPLSPSAALLSGGGAAVALSDAVTLKASAPVALSPIDGVRVDSRRPTLTVDNASGNFVQVGFGYRFLVLDENGGIIYDSGPVGQGTGTTSHQVGQDLPFGRRLTWVARAELEDGVGPFSNAGAFLTPEPPPPPPPPPQGPPPPPQAPDGSVGPPRNIPAGEALEILIDVHNRLGFNLGSGSSRDDRVRWLWTAVAVIHYGHPVFNPAGPDPNWCVKDAGGGRPPSDDVLVRCDNSEAYDTVAGAGANGYSFHLESLGSLPAGQNIYPPPASYLP